MSKSRSPRTFPKENEKKLKDKIQRLRGQINQLQKENRILKDELVNILKPVRKRKSHKEQPKLTSDEWRKKFVEEVKADLKRRQEEAECTINLKKGGSRTST